VTPATLPVLLLVFLTGVATEAHSQTGQTRTPQTNRRNASRSRTFIINVKDNAGSPVPNAVAFLGEVSAESADSEGVIRIEPRAFLRLPMLVDVRARGFCPRQVLVEGFEQGSIDVYLEKVETGAPRRERTVSVGELSPDNRAASQKLEEATLRALESGDNQKAEELLRMALDENQSSSAIYINLGIAILRQGRTDEAAGYLEKGFQLAPYDRTAAGNLGLMRWVQGRHEECYDLLDRAVALGFQSPLAHYYLGVLSLGRGYYKQSAEVLGSLDPNRFRYRDLYLSVALRGLGKLQLARKTFLEFLQRNPVEMLPFAARALPGTAGGR
jgi:hypothetical protein